jgi:hypothetical protein
MADKKTASSETKRARDVPYPGMLGDGTEEQNLNQIGNPDARINENEVAAAFPAAKK